MSLSMISAAARNRRIAASPFVSEPLPSSAKSGTLWAMIPVPRVAAAPVTPRQAVKVQRHAITWTYAPEVCGCPEIPAKATIEERFRGFVGNPEPMRLLAQHRTGRELVAEPCPKLDSQTQIHFWVIPRIGHGP